MYRLLLLLALAACSNPDDTDPAGDTDADADTDADSDTDTDTDTDTDADTDADACDPRVHYAGCSALMVQDIGDGALKPTVWQWDGSGNVLKSERYDEAMTAVLSSNEWTYTDDRLVRIQMWSGSTLQADQTYTYDAEGNLVEQREAVGGSVYTFRRDEQGREIGSEFDREGDGVIDDTCNRAWEEVDGVTRWQEVCTGGVRRTAELDDRGQIVTFGYEAPSYWSLQTNSWTDDCQLESASTESIYGPSTWQATFDDHHRQVVVLYQSGSFASREDIAYTCE